MTFLQKWTPSSWFWGADEGPKDAGAAPASFGVLVCTQKPNRRGGILQKGAFKDAFSKAYPGKDIQESSSTNEYGTTHYLNVVFTDSTLSAISTKYYRDKYLSELNNKK